jgi:hypothetical protein
MYYNQFIRSLTGSNAINHIRSFGHLIEKTEDGILIDGEATSFKELEEARQHIKTQYDTKTLEEQIKTELYDEISDNKIANIIKEHHDIRVTDTLIESYIELASSKLFTVDPVVQEIRSLNKFDKLIEGKIDYKLEDGTIIAINEDTQNKLKDLFSNQQEIIEHMRQSKDNFISVLKQIGE